MKFDGADPCIVSSFTFQQTRIDASSADSATVGTFLTSNKDLWCPTNFVTMKGSTVNLAKLLSGK